MPLLIGGATTSRVHTAVKIAPALRARPDRPCASTPAARSAWSPACCRRRHAPRIVADGARRISQGRARRTRAARPSKRAAARAGARQRARRSTGAPITPPKPTFLGTRVFAIFDLAELARYIDWTPFFHDLGADGPLSRDPRRRQARRGGARAVRRRAGDADADRRREAGSTRAGGRRLLAGERGSATTSCSTPTRRATAPMRDAATRFASRSAKRDGAAAIVALADFVAPQRAGAATTSAASRSPPGIGEDERSRERFERAQRRLFARSWSRRLPTAWPKPSPSACTSACARELWGYAPRRGAQPDELIARALPRHPPGARLSGPARPHREATLFDLLDAERAIGHQAHRELRHVAGLVGVAASTSPTRDAHYFGVGEGRARPGRGLRRPQGHGGRRSGALARPGAELRSGARRGGGITRVDSIWFSQRPPLISALASLCDNKYRHCF